jgi:hypothetical protein
MKKKKKVPYKWYKEIANELARNCMEKALKFGLDSQFRIDAENKRKEFKNKYIPVKELQGNIQAAKLEIIILHDKIIKSNSIHSKYDPYNIIGVMEQKYFLSNKQIDSLMAFMSKKELLY